MGTQGSLRKICNMMGNYRTFLLGRPACVNYQQRAGLKQSLEEKIGLPQKPRRPLTPYFRFLNQVRPTLMKNNPDAKITEIAKMAGHQWEKIGASSKQELESAYRKDIEVYLKAMEKYDSKLSDGDRMKIKDARKDIVDQREKHKMKLKVKELGKPKRPVSSYLLFINEKIAARGNLSIAEWRTKVLAQWNSLPEKDKEVYVKKQKAAQEVYKVELRQWEERMIRLGHIDVVRNEALIEPRPIKKKTPRTDKE